MKNIIYLLVLCMVCIGGSAQNIVVTSWDDLAKSISTEELRELESKVYGYESSMSVYPNGYVHSFLKKGQEEIDILFMNGLFPLEVVKNVPEFKESMNNIRVVCIDLSEAENLNTMRNVDLKFSLLPNLQYIVLTSISENQLIKAEVNFKARANQKGGDSKRILLLSQLQPENT
ncbi:hypothetical protein ACYSNX_03365 [Myroides sp. LJL115]